MTTTRQRYNAKIMNQEIDYIQIIKELMETIDSFKLKFEEENDYLKSCDGLLKIFNELTRKKNEVQNHIVFTRMSRIRRNSNLILDNATKIMAGYKTCKRCDRLVLHLKLHQETNLCLSIYRSKIEVIKKNLSIKNIEGPTGVRGRNSDNKLLLEKLSWQPSQSLKEGMKTTYKWIENQI